MNRLGMVMDFTDLKNRLRTALEELDHKDLNKLAYFSKVNPTSENIAKYIHRQLKVKGSIKVTVWESDATCATYSR